MEHHEVIDTFQKAIIEIYTKEDLTCLRGLKNEYKLNGREILMWHSDVVRKNEIKLNLSKLYFNNLNDLFFCSDEILYFTAHLFLYRPYINSPLKDVHIFNGEEIFPNHQNLAAKRYNMFADVASQKLYNYWDRIGDLIATYFPGKIKPTDIYFSKAVDIIPKEFHESENFIWLKNFKETEYVKLNSIRKQIVHYYTTDTEYTYKHLEIVRDREEMELLQSKRESLPEFYKEQIEFTLLGFEKTLLLLQEINEVYFPVVDSE